MAGEIVGGCQCGQVRYALRAAALNVVVCHCRECQRQSGSAFGMSLAARPETLSITAGAVRTFDVACDSGRVKTCAFCPSCGARLFHQTSRGISIKAGTLDDTSGLVPQAHYWTARKQPWVVIPDGTPQYEDDG